MAARCAARVEIADQRTEVAQTFVEPSGSFTSQVGVTPQRVHRSDGSWAPVSTRLVRAADGSFAAQASVADVRFSDGGAGPFAMWRSGGSTFTLAWPTPLPTPRVVDDTAVFDEVLPGVALHVTALVDGFRHALEVKTAAAAANPALRQIRYVLGGTAARRATAGGGTDLVDASGEVFATTAGASMWDSASPAVAAPAKAGSAGLQAAPTQDPELVSTASRPGAAANARPVQVSVADSSLTVIPDAAMLADAKTVFPVFIDPPFNGQRSKWAWANDGNDNTDVEGRARVGRNPYDGALYRSFFDFNITAMKGSTVLAAHIDMTLDHSYSCSNTPVYLYRTGAITAASGQRMAWGTRPLPGVSLDSWSGHADEAGGCGVKQPDAKAVFDGGGVRTDVQTAARGTSNTYTVGLCACNTAGNGESTQDRWKKFLPNTAYLVATYDKAPNAPTAQAFSRTTDCYKACTSPAVVRTPQPTLITGVSDPNGGNLRTVFEVRAAASANATLVVGNAGGPDVSVSGDTATWRVPAGKLANSGTYYWRAQSTDENSLAGGWSAWQTLQIDTTPPGQPTVSSPEYPRKEWGKLPGEAGVFTASGTDDVADVVWSFDGGAFTTTAASGTPKTVTANFTPSTDLVHVFHARAVDVAGNSSATYDHQFWVSSTPSRCWYWRFNETTGTTVGDSGKDECSPTDSSVSAVQGAVTGNAAFRSGFDGNALWLTGTGGAVTMGGPVLDTNKSFTVTAWVNPSDLSVGDQTIVSQDGANTSRFQLRFDAGANDGRGGWCLAMHAADDATAPVTTCATGTVADDTGRTHQPASDTWVHLAAVYDAPAHHIQLHVMGNPTSCAGEMVQADVTGSWDTTGALVVGRAYGGGEPWRGGVDELRAYPMALSTAKICQLATP